LPGLAFKRVSSQDIILVFFFPHVPISEPKVIAKLTNDAVKDFFWHGGTIETFATQPLPRQTDLSTDLSAAGRTADSPSTRIC
jgi:hypothetical protein